MIAMRHARRAVLVSLAVLLLGLPGVAGGSYHGGGPPPGFGNDPCDLGQHIVPGSGTVREVGPGKQYGTIKAAVDAAVEGDAVLVFPGTYEEHVVVATPGLRIRGTDRATVVLDGGATRQYAFEVKADRVLIENMTAFNYTRTAFWWYGVVGYWGRSLTAYSNGLYGIYALNSRCGQFNDSYTSGNADSGFYIGECFTCDAVIHDVVAEQNALGYSGTNAGGNLVLRDSIWRDNAMGIVPNSLDGEEHPPQRAATIIRNTVVDNNRIDAPGTGLAGLFWGVGIAVAGGKENVIAGNTVTDHALGGIVLAPLPDQNVWIPSANVVWGNVVGHDPDEWPDAIDLGQGVSSGPENCWSFNEPAPGKVMTTAPVGLQTVWACGAMFTPPGGDLRIEAGLAMGVAGLNGRDPSPWKTWPAPTNPVAFENLADPDCDGGTDCSVARWLPALGLD